MSALRSRKRRALRLQFLPVESRLPGRWRPRFVCDRRQCRSGIRDDSQAGRVVAPRLVRIDVDLDEARWRDRKCRSVLPAARVGLWKPGPNREDEIGGGRRADWLPDCPRSRPCPQLRMVGRQGSRPHRGVTDGDLRGLGQTAPIPPPARRVPPPARMNGRSARSSWRAISSAEGRLDRGPLEWRSGHDRRVEGFGQDVHRHRHEHRPRAARPAPHPTRGRGREATWSARSSRHVRLTNGANTLV